MNSDPLYEKKARIIKLHDTNSPETPSHKGIKRFFRMGRNPSAPAEKPGDAAIKKLFEEIVSAANQCHFTLAEQLRAQLIREAPTAVSAIVKSGEIIEQRKKTGMDPDKIRPWADLFNQFTSEEAAVFYFSLKEFSLKPNQTLFQQGSCDNRLYFIRSGRLKLKYFDYKLRKNVAIATLGRGDIAGIEAFFTLSNHTTSLIAAEESEILYLDKAAYQKIVAEKHSIESKILKYCESKQISCDQNQTAQSGRRAHQRFKTELIGTVWRLDQEGRLEPEAAEVRIVDISVGGLGYRVNNLKIGDAACLHNSRIVIAASYSRYGLSHELKKTGTVVSLKFDPLGECSVHVQFSDPLDESQVIDIAQNSDIIAYI